MAITALTVPKWGIEMQEATLAEWKAELGDTVEKGAEIVDLETDKIINTHEAPANGILIRQIGELEQVYSVGELIGVIADAGTPEADIDAFVANFEPVDASFDSDGDAPVSENTDPTPASPAAPSGEVRISPIAQRLAEANGIDWSTITGTGRNGRISKQDVEAAMEASAAGAVMKRTALARAAGARMQLAKQEVPHFYLEMAVNCDALLAARKAYNQSQSVTTSVNDALIKAVALAMQATPEVAVIFKDDELYAADDAVGVAVATDAGLVAPVVQNAAAGTLAELSGRIRDLAERAKGRDLTADELGGGPTTVSNLGMFGIDRFTAIINPPQTSIIAVGRAMPQAVVIDGALSQATLMQVTMSCDHRAFDGATGARFLQALKEIIEEPAAIFT